MVYVEVGEKQQNSKDEKSAGSQVLAREMLREGKKLSYQWATKKNLRGSLPGLCGTPGGQARQV